jgi:phosphatidylinositol alpha-1,6-mannosyltransferase
MGWLTVFTVATLALARGTPPPLAVALTYLAIVFGASVAGGRRLGLALATIMALTFAYRFAAPYDSIAIDRPIDGLILIAFLATSVVVTTFVTSSASARAAPARRPGPTPRPWLALDRPAGSSSARRRRIVILTEDSKPALGGIAEYLHQLASSLSATHDILIVSCIPGADTVAAGPNVRYREVRWFRTHHRMPGDQWTLTRRANTLAWRFLMQRYVETTLADLAGDAPLADTTFVIGRMSVVAHPWCVACRALGIPYVAFAYGLELIDAVPPASVAHRHLDVASAEHWFPISADTQQLLDTFGVPRDRQTMLSPAVDPNAVAPPSPQARAAVRDRLGLGHDRFLLTLCHLRARKGVDLSLRAFAAVADQFPDVRYVIAGVGPEFDALVALARSLDLGDRVVFAGRVDDTTRNALLAECAVFVMANRRFARDVEGFGIVFLEAALHAKPSIGGKNGGVPDAVDDGVTGLLADTDTTPDDVARAMRQLLADPDRAAQMGGAGRARAIDGFAWSARAAIFAGTIDELARRDAADASSPRVIVEPHARTG